MFGVPEDGIVFLDVERDVLAPSTRLAKVSREEDPYFLCTGVCCVLFIIETQVVCRSLETVVSAR